MKKLLLLAIALLGLNGALHAGDPETGTTQQEARRQHHNARLDHAREEAQEILGDTSRLQEDAQNLFDDKNAFDATNFEDLRNKIVPMFKDKAQQIEAQHFIMSEARREAQKSVYAKEFLEGVGEARD